MHADLPLRRLFRPVFVGVVCLLLGADLACTAFPASGAPATGPGAIPPANDPSNPVNPASPVNANNVPANAPVGTPAAPPPGVLSSSGGIDSIDGAPRPDAPPATRNTSRLAVVMSLDQFIQRVLHSNLDLAAQRFNVPIAKAQLIAARVSPNPVLNVGTGRDLTHEDQPTTYFAGLSTQIELPGKRANRTSAALQTLLAASATLEDYLRTLRGTAASAYVDAAASRLIVGEKLRAFQSLSRLADANDVRFKAGDISEVDDDQAHADALQARGDLYSSQSTGRANLYALLGFLGHSGAPLPGVSSRLHVPARRFDLDKLLAGALKTRPDIESARRTYEAALSTTRLAHLNRVPDPTLGVTAQESLISRNPIDPTPNFNSINLSVSVPLPLFNSSRGEYLVAQNTAAQAERTLRSAGLKVEVDVRGAFARYQTALERLAQYEHGALTLASKVLAAQLLAYKAGSATLLDVLQAQKVDTDVHLAYLDALSERAKAMIALEQAANLWDLDF